MQKGGTSPSRLVPITLLYLILLHQTVNAIVFEDVKLNRANITNWTTCDAFGGQNSTLPHHYNAQIQCTYLTAPLCYHNICSDTKQTVRVRVKRISQRSQNEEATNATILWLLQYGPGTSQDKLERIMIHLYNQFDGKVSIFTMEQRGIGASTELTCRSVTNCRLMTPIQAATCIGELNRQYGAENMRGFSTWSAAHDLASFIEAFQSNSRVFVYGAAISSAVVEKLMHFKLNNLHGYIMDNYVSTQSKIGSLSRLDFLFGQTMETFLQRCEQDAFCGKKFQGKSVIEEINAMNNYLDTAAALKNRCAQILQSSLIGTHLEEINILPSYTFRRMLAKMFVHYELKKMIPIILYRMKRCDAQHDDPKVLSFFFQKYVHTKVAQHGNTYFDSLLGHLIGFSEMWEKSSPDRSTMEDRFAAHAASTGGAYFRLPLYCAMAQVSNDTVCNQPTKRSDAISILYNEPVGDKKVSVPPAPVLIFSSSLNARISSQYSSDMAASWPTSSSLYFEFENATNLAIFEKANTIQACSQQILISFVLNQGELAKVNNSCLRENMSPLDLSISSREQEFYFGVADGFEGMKAETSYRDQTITHIVVTIVFFIIVLIAMICVMCRCNRAIEQEANENGAAMSCYHGLSKEIFRATTMTSLRSGLLPSLQSVTEYPLMDRKR